MYGNAQEGFYYAFSADSETHILTSRKYPTAKDMLESMGALITAMQADDFTLIGLDDGKDARLMTSSVSSVSELPSKSAKRKDHGPIWQVSSLHGPVVHLRVAKCDCVVGETMEFFKEKVIVGERQFRVVQFISSQAGFDVYVAAVI